MHELQTTQRSRSILHVLSSFSTQIASEGHFFMHIPHEIHREGSITTCPRESPVFFPGRAGYISVAGRLITVRIAVFAISKKAIPLTSPYTRYRDQY